MFQSAYTNRLRKNVYFTESGFCRLGAVISGFELLLVAVGMINPNINANWPPFNLAGLWTCPPKEGWLLTFVLGGSLLVLASAFARAPEAGSILAERCPPVLPFWMRWLAILIPMSAALISYVIVNSLPLFSAASFLAFETATVISVLSGIIFDRKVNEGLAASAKSAKR